MGSIDVIRPLLVSVDGEARVSVALEWDSGLFVGEADVDPGEAADVSRLHAGARATLAALDQLTPAAVGFSLEWVDRVATARHLPEIVAAVARVEVASVPMRYAGAVIAEGQDPALLASRAALDAVNRRLGVTGL